MSKQHMDLVNFFVDAAPLLAAAGHHLAAMKVVAWIQDGSKPTRLIIKDEVLPCLKDMVLFDEQGWGPLREYVHSVTGEKDGSLGLDLGAVGRGVGGPRAAAGTRGPNGGILLSSLGVTESQNSVDLFDGEAVESLDPAEHLAHPVDTQNNGGQERKRNRPNNRGGLNGAKRQKVLGSKHASEELKHSESESEVETPDPDYDPEDGFVVRDEEALEYESDISDPENIPEQYTLSDC